MKAKWPVQWESYGKYYDDLSWDHILSGHLPIWDYSFKIPHDPHYALYSRVNDIDAKNFIYFYLLENVEEIVLDNDLDLT